VVANVLLGWLLGCCCGNARVFQVVTKVLLGYSINNGDLSSGWLLGCLEWVSMVLMC